MQNLRCPSYLNNQGTMMQAEIIRENNEWNKFRIDRPGIAKKSGAYLVKSLPVEFHCHGVGNYDFSEIEDLDLDEINRQAKQEGVFCVPSIFLAHSKLDYFLRFMKNYATRRKNNELEHVVGISLEGPLLASFAGTPERGNWPPNKTEWEKIASCGELGLIYVVISPDAMLKGSFLLNGITKDHPSLDWIIATLVENGVKPAIGHFLKDNPEQSAECIKKVLLTAQKHSNFAGPDAVLTDHLLNDMPKKIPHAWRTMDAKRNRAQQIKFANLDKWNLDNLEEVVGKVPGLLMKAANEGLLTLCMNFDGEHVDLEISRRVVELLGTKSIIAMTDRIDVSFMGGQLLEKKPGSNLWFQGKGVVAAGSYTIDRQIHNLRAIGLNEASIWDMTSFVPLRVIGDRIKEKSNKLSDYCYISETKDRFAFEAVSHEKTLTVIS